jgi:Uncharacterized protein conserved in bacteria
VNSTGFVAFLRGINISGKNKIVMSDLKTEFEKLGYAEVSTYLNSGNVMFSSEVVDKKQIRYNIEKMILNSFEVAVPVYVIEMEKINHIFEAAPLWWGTSDKNKYDNIIFILSDDTPEMVVDLIGPVSEMLEKIQIFEDIIFWTFDKLSYRKCNWWKKTAKAGIAEKLTIRTANTIKKLC